MLHTSRIRKQWTMTDNATITNIFRYRPHFESCLNIFFSEHRSRLEHYKGLTPLLDAMEYSTLDAGKRVRAMLVYLTAECCGYESHNFSSEPLVASVNDFTIVDVAAIAIELIHSYSLIHDDLPAMDDDALRRGKPTCHIALGEANAILAGDALQALAFEILSNYGHIDANQRIALINTVATAAGSSGMVAGQCIDLMATNQSIPLAELITMHQLKTGALIEASIHMGALSVNANKGMTNALQSYGEALGLAFQIKDDILDIEGDPQLTGKSRGADIAANKSTFPSLLGLEKANDEALSLLDKALNSLEIFGERAETLKLLAQYFVDRKT